MRYLLLLIGPPYLNGVRLGKDQKTNTVKSHGQKRLDYVFKIHQLLYTQH